MQPPRGSNFERARNVDLQTRWAGDPERWGASTTWDTSVTATSAISYSPPLLRAQCRDLIATGWDFFATWEAHQVVLAEDSFQLFLEVALGTGQATSTALFLLATKAAGAAPTSQNPGALATGWFPVPPPPVGAAVYNGVAMSAQPVIATSLNVRAVIVIKHAGGGANHRVRTTVNAHVAPRSWVP